MRRAMLSLYNTQLMSMSLDCQINSSRNKSSHSSQIKSISSLFHRWKICVSHMKRTLKDDHENNREVPNRQVRWVPHIRCECKEGSKLSCKSNASVG